MYLEIVYLIFTEDSLQVKEVQVWHGGSISQKKHAAHRSPDRMLGEVSARRQVPHDEHCIEDREGFDGPWPPQS